MKKFYQFFCLIFLSANLAAGNFYSWDFDSCELKDILFMISTDTGISISADDTVTGRGSLKFSGSDFNVAFESFLEENRLFVTKTDSRWVVSRFYLTIITIIIYVFKMYCAKCHRIKKIPNRPKTQNTILTEQNGVLPQKSIKIIMTKKSSYIV